MGKSRTVPGRTLACACLGVVVLVPAFSAADTAAAGELCARGCRALGEALQCGRGPCFTLSLRRPTKP